MSKSKLTTERIIGVLKQQEAGQTTGVGPRDRGF